MPRIPRHGELSAAFKLAWLLPLVLGATLGSLPHLAQRWHHGTWTFLGDNDDVYYGMIARAPFHGSWSVHDPFASAAESIPVSYAWGLFVPMAKLVALVSDNPAVFLLGWRLAGGALLGAGLWYLLTQLARRMGGRFSWLVGSWGIAGLCAALSAFVLCDPGFCHGSLPGERIGTTLVHLLRHELPRRNPGWYIHLRVVSPLCGAGAFLALLGLLSLPRLSRRGIVAAGVLLGVLMNLYFFFWTTMVGLLLVMAALPVVPNRIGRRLGVRHSSSSLLVILAIGLALGTPQLLSDLSSFGDPIIKEALERTPRGLALAWGNPARWLYLTAPRLWLACALSVIAAVRVRALRIPALVVVLSFALGNSALVTGLEFENYKWLHATRLVSYVVVLLWLFAELKPLATRHANSAKTLRGLIAGSAALGFAVAALWIPGEALRTQEAKERTEWSAEVASLVPFIAKLDPASLLVAPAHAQPLLLRTRAGILYERPHTVCSMVSDLEFIERDVLSAWVLNQDLTNIDQSSDLRLTFYGEIRPRWLERAARYRAAAANRSREALDRYHVRYAVNECNSAPAIDSGVWRELFRSARWCVWERD